MTELIMKALFAVGLVVGVYGVVLDVARGVGVRTISSRWYIAGGALLLTVYGFWATHRINYMLLIIAYWGYRTGKSHMELIRKRRAGQKKAAGVTGQATSNGEVGEA